MSETTITLIAAIAFTVIGVGSFFHLFLMVLRWPRATGTVIGNVAQRRSTEGNEYAQFPKIEFQATNGKTYEVRGISGSTMNGPLGRRSNCAIARPIQITQLSRRDGSGCYFQPCLSVLRLPAGKRGR